MQAGHRDRPAHRIQGARFIRPLQVAPAFAAALLGAFGQEHRFGKRLRHQRASRLIAGAHGRRFDRIEGKGQWAAGLIGKHLFQFGFVLRQQFRPNARIVWMFCLHGALSMRRLFMDRPFRIEK
jgi:hypothetical protein